MSRVKKIDLLILSDIHLGTYDCHVKELYYNEEWHLFEYDESEIALRKVITDKLPFIV